MIHLRIPYYRPSWQGGDVAHPLCCVPITGWSGPHHAALDMTEIVEHVDCPQCRAFHARGGVKARHAWLMEFLANRNVTKPQLEWLAEAQGRAA